MKEITNRFGTGQLLEESDLRNTNVCIVSNACMSVTSDMKSYVSYTVKHRDDFAEKSDYNTLGFLTECDLKDGDYNESNCIIIVLGCQVTDLAILNDIRTLERLHSEYPKARIAMGGCLAYRFDIEIPSWCLRIEAIRKEGNEITMAGDVYVEWEKPFWVNKHGVDSLGKQSASLFRESYPLKIGAGCHGKCKYCTIRDTRGDSYECDAYLQVQEFLKHRGEDIVLTSDSPTVNQINDWCDLSARYNIPISIRNVEPHIALSCMYKLYDLSKKGLLKVLHCPIQSNKKELLEAMERPVEKTMEYIEKAQILRGRGVYVATNIIIDYVYTDKDGNEVFVKNMDKEWLDSHFDYWVWNPYFDGKWDRQKAEERYKKYIEGIL